MFGTAEILLASSRASPYNNIECMVDSYQVLLIVYQRDVTNVRQSCGYRETVVETTWTAEMSCKADVAKEDFGVVNMRMTTCARHLCFIFIIKPLQNILLFYIILKSNSCTHTFRHAEKSRTINHPLSCN